MLEMERLVEEGDTLRWLEVDRHFHFSSYAGCDMPRLMRMIKQCWDWTQQYRRIYMHPHTLEPGDRYELIRADHRLLFEAFRQRNPDDAARLLEIHIRRVRLTLSEQLLFADASGDM